MITLAVMSATLIQVLDTTIVNVALPHMQGELGATSDQISWVLTSYLVSSAIFMPLTGYFTDVWGRKRFLLICIAGFVAASALCGISQSVAQIVFFRLLQGIFGAALVPLSQAIMADAYPPHERGKAMAIWGLGVMVGPVAGPTLGGWLTDIASWRWTFYINLPVGALSLFLAAQFVPDSERRERRMDWFGFGFIALGIAGLQYVFDRGNQQDWFDGIDIRWAAAAAVIGWRCSSPTACEILRSAIFDVRHLHGPKFRHVVTGHRLHGTRHVRRTGTAARIARGIARLSDHHDGRAHGAARNRHGHHHDHRRTPGLARRRALPGPAPGLRSARSARTA